jgi:DHA3 family macrolide efflux protein-like MFS transporter
VLLGGIALGLIAGLLAGGRLSHLGDVRLRWAALIFSAVILRFGEEIALSRGVPFASELRVPLYALSFAVLAAGLWVNRRFPGLLLAFVGVAFNGVAIVLNGGYMPVWVPSLDVAGLTTADVNPALHTLLTPPIDERFLVALGPLVDIIPVPLPIIRNVVSMGDVFIALGLALFLFATVVRTPDEAEAEGDAVPLVGLAGTARMPRGLAPLVDRGQVRAETGLAPGLAQAAALERPLVLAGTGPGLAAPALAPLAAEEVASVAVGTGAIARPRPTPEFLRRARRHPYVRLALNGSFSALWAGQLISVFGDRVHQIALAFLVYQATGSAIAVGLIFLTATLPNLLLGPIAGTLVDRWDQKEVMVVADLLRAALILLIPVAAVVNLALVYPLVFAVTAVSIFFRPARTAVLPRLVREEDLLTANSAIWLGETFADVIGYPLAAGFVVALGASLPLAFWFDAVTYVASAILIGSIAVPALVRSEPVVAGLRGVVDDLVAGWRFLRGETVLLANTLQGVAGQFTTGVMLAITVIYATEVIAGGDVDGGKVAYGLLETGIGMGNLIGGFAIGLLGARLAKGRLVILGYAAAGACTMGLAFVGDLPAAFGLMLGGGIANMVYIIPSQTLFQERAPADMIGRVVGFRFALVFGALTLAMGVGGIAVEVIGITWVLLLGGLLTFGAGVAGWFVPEVRDA